MYSHIIQGQIGEVKKNIVHSNILKKHFLS